MARKRRSDIYRPPRIAAAKKLSPVRSERTYRTGDRRWRTLREAVLHDNPLCVKCASMEPPVFVPAVDVDHIDGDATNNKVENLQGLCKPCHSRKTRLETIAGRTQ